MRLVSIDPGVHHWGLAVWDEGRLTYATLATSIIELDDLQADKVVIEKPFVVGGRAVRGKTSDLIDLAVVVGRLYERFSFEGVKEIALLTENQWKGGVPKEKMHARAYDKLSHLELTQIEILKNKARNLDIWDAVALGLKVLKR